MNIWKEIDEKRIAPDDFIAFIEIEKGCKVKYELDKETGLIIMDRVLYTATHYPMNYGFIPKTYCDDKDPLDVFVLCSESIKMNSLVRCYPIGVVSMLDRGEHDEKIIAIPFADPSYNCYRDINALPKHIFDELMHFLTVYKQLENKKVNIGKLGGREDAIECIKNAKILYKKTFAKESK